MRMWIGAGLLVTSALFVAGCDSNPSGPSATAGPSASAPTEAPPAGGTQKAAPRRGGTPPKGLEPASAQ